MKGKKVEGLMQTTKSSVRIANLRAQNMIQDCQLCRGSRIPVRVACWGSKTPI